MVGPSWRVAVVAAASVVVAGCERLNEPTAPVSTSRLVEVSVAQAGTAPVIEVPRDGVVTVAFTNERDQPRPVAEVAGQAEWLHYRRADSHPHVLVLQAVRGGPASNLALLFNDLATPVHLGVVARSGQAATQVVVRLTPGTPGDAAAVTAAADSPPNAPTASAPDRASVESIIHDYLLANPDVLRDAMDPRRQLVAQTEQHRDELVSAAGVPVLGDAAGGITVVEFFDYRCGFCKRSLDAVRTALARPGVRVAMREYPILGEGSVRAARAALAAARQERYEEAHLALMEHEGDFDDATVARIAAELDLDLQQLRADMASPDIDALIEANRALARRLGVTGTPAFLVLGPERVEVSPGALDADRLVQMIDAAG